MRKKESPQITPLMHISIFLTFGILIAKMGYGYIDTIYWLVAALFSFTFAPRNQVRIFG